MGAPRGGAMLPNVAEIPDIDCSQPTHQLRKSHRLPCTTEIGVISVLRAAKRDAAKPCHCRQR
jgi:hypothetical protein